MWSPRPSENFDVARRFGLTWDDVQLTPDSAQMRTEPLPMIGGQLPAPIFERSYVPGPEESEAVESIKAAARLTHDRSWFRLGLANEESLAINKDPKLTTQGRYDATRAVLDKWIAWDFVGGFADRLDGYCALLLAELDRVSVPPALKSSDAAGAVLDSEYRALVRAIDTEARRYAHLMKLSIEEPDSPVLAAALRADPAASGLSKEHHAALVLRHGIARNPAAIRGVWTAACALDAGAWIVLHGTARLAAAAGATGGQQHQRIKAGIEGSANRKALAERLATMVHAAETVEVAIEETVE